MSARLSRRCAHPSYYPPLTELSLEDGFELFELVNQRDTEFEDLPERYQRLILEAEANLQRAIEAFQMRGGAPSAITPIGSRGLPAAHPSGPAAAAAGRTESLPARP